MDVLAGHIDLQFARVDVGEDALQAANDGAGLLRREHADLAQHARVGDGTGDVLSVHARVKADGLIQPVEALVHVAREPSLPEFHNSAFLQTRKRSVPGAAQSAEKPLTAKIALIK